MSEYTKPIEQVIAEEIAGQTAQKEINDFAEWANRNPLAITGMRKKAYQYLARGKEVSVNHLLGWLRYDSNIRINAVTKPYDFKAPNHFATIFARYLVEYDPDFEGYIQLNKSKYDADYLQYPPIGWGY